MKQSYQFPVTNDVIEEARKLLVVQEPNETDVRMFYEVCKEALKSDDPNTQVGAIVVDATGNIIARAHAHFPVGMGALFNWVKPAEEERVPFSKYPYLVRAEYTAAQEAKKVNGTVEGCTMYMNLGCGDQQFAQLVDEKLTELVAMVPDGLDWQHLLSNAVMCVQSRQTDHPINIRFVKLIDFPDAPWRFKALAVTHHPGVQKIQK